MSAEPVLVIDCGSSRVSAGHFVKSGDGRLVLDRFFFEELPPDLDDDRRWIEAVAEILRQFRGLARGEDAVQIIIPSHLALTKFIRVPHVDRAKLRKIVHFEARQNIPYPLEDVVWDFSIIADDEVETEICLCAVKTDILEQFCSRSRAAGIDAARITPSCLAQVNSFHYGYDGSDGSHLVINVGARSTNLVFISADRYYVRNLALAGNAVTTHLMDARHLNFEQAEALKLDYFDGGRVEDEAVAGILTEGLAGFTSRLSTEVVRSLANYRRQGDSEMPQKIFVTGGGSLPASFPRLLSERMKMPVERLDALNRVRIGSGVNAASVERHAHFLGEAVGGAVDRLTGGPAGLNLLPPRVLRSRRFQRQQPYYIGAAVLTAAAVLLPVLNSNVTVDAYREKTRALEAQIRPLRRIQAEIRNDLQTIDKTRNEIQAIQGLVETKSNWISFFSDLQTRLDSVEDVWLDKLEVLRSSEKRGGGFASSIFGKLGAQKTEPESLRLNLTGRLLDRKNPLSKVSQASYRRVKDLLNSFVGSKFIVAVKDERFDNSQPGILKFDFVLVINPKNPL